MLKLHFEQLFLHSQTDIFDTLYLSEFGKQLFIFLGVSDGKLVRIFDNGVSEAAVLGRYQGKSSAEAFKYSRDRMVGADVSGKAET